MNKLLSTLKTILWALSIPFVLLYAQMKRLSIKIKAKKYKNHPEDFLDVERYTDVYNLLKLVRYMLRVKNENKLGKEKIPNRPQLIVANHRSSIDPMLLFMVCFEQLNNNFIFIAKKELRDSKYGFIYEYIGTLFLDRENLRDGIKIIEKQAILLKQGKTIVVFPEGTRTHTDEMIEFKSGAFEPAYKAMCSIQPIVFLNTEQHLELKKEIKNKAPIKMVIMKSIQPDKFIVIDRNIFARNVQKEMQSEYNKNK